MRSILQIIITAIIVVFIEFLLVIRWIGIGLGCSYDPGRCNDTVMINFLFMVFVPIIALVFIIISTHGRDKKVTTNQKINLTTNGLVPRVILSILAFAIFVVFALLLNRYWWWVDVYILRHLNHPCIRLDSCETPAKDIKNLFK